MRIFCLYHHPLPTRAADTMQIMKMGQAFRREGHDVTLFAPRSEEYNGDLAALWLRYGITTPFAITFTRRIQWLRKHDIAFKAVRYAQQHGAEMVYARGALPAMWASQRGIPTLLDAHAPPGARMAKYYLRRVFTGRGFRRLVVITEPVRQAFLATYGDLLCPEQILVDPNGVDLEAFDQLPTPAAARDLLHLAAKFTIGYVGHLYPGRGIGLILELAQRLPELQFLLVGGMPDDLERWRQKMTQLALTNVHFTGFLPYTDLPLHYAACDVLLMPYERKIAVYGGKGDSAAYASPMKLFEYMASQRLIIASDLPVLREILNEQNAVLCPPEPTDEWESAIRQARENPVWAAQLIRQARQDVAGHTWQQRAHRLLRGLTDHNHSDAERKNNIQSASEEQT